MCLKGTPLTPQELEAAIPGDVFLGFKFVTVRDGKLISPSYHYEWQPGVNKAKGDMQHPDHGLYLFAANPNELNAQVHETVLPVIIKREHVKRGGPDNHAGAGGTCFICTECEVTQEAYDNAVSGKTKNEIWEKAKEMAKAFVSKVKEAVKQEKVETPEKKEKKKQVKKEVKQQVVKEKEAAKKEANSPKAKSIKKLIKKAKKVAKKVIKKNSKKK
jgi:hypothetical protein